MDLIFDDEKMDFYPNFRDLEEAVLEIANLISNTMQVGKYIDVQLCCESVNQIGWVYELMFDIKSCLSHRECRRSRHG